MKRLQVRRWLKWLGVIVCALLLTTWGRSYWNSESVGWVSNSNYKSNLGSISVRHRWAIWSSYGGVAVWREWAKLPRIVPASNDFYCLRNARSRFVYPYFNIPPNAVVPTWPSALGITYYSYLNGSKDWFEDGGLEYTNRISDQSGLLGTIVPYWLLAFFSIIPTIYLFWRDRRRIPAGHCRKCGYNLTGNISGACPECGTKILRHHEEMSGSATSM